VWFILVGMVFGFFFMLLDGGSIVYESLCELLSLGGYLYLFEFFLFKDDVGEVQLWIVVCCFEWLWPIFVFVIYGVGGMMRDCMVRIIEWIVCEMILMLVVYFMCVSVFVVDLCKVIG